MRAWTKTGRSSWRADLPDGRAVTYSYQPGRIGGPARSIPTGRWRSYGRIIVEAPGRATIAFARESAWRRLVRLTGYSVEQASGDPRFDRSIYIYSDDRDLVAQVGDNPQLRDLVLQLLGDRRVTDVSISSMQVTATLRSDANLLKSGRPLRQARLDALVDLLERLDQVRAPLTGTPLPPRRHERLFGRQFGLPGFLAFGWLMLGLVATAVYAMLRLGDRVVPPPTLWIVPAAGLLFALPMLWVGRRRSDSPDLLAITLGLSGFGMIFALLVSLPGHPALDHLALPVVAKQPGTAPKVEVRGLDAPLAVSADVAAATVLGRDCLFVSGRKEESGRMEAETIGIGDCKLGAVAAHDALRRDPLRGAAEGALVNAYLERRPSVGDAR